VTVSMPPLISLQMVMQALGEEQQRFKISMLVFAGDAVRDPGLILPALGGNTMSTFSMRPSSELSGVVPSVFRLVRRGLQTEQSWSHTLELV
jgi:hypothetical protein